MKGNRCHSFPGTKVGCGDREAFLMDVPCAQWPLDHVPMS